MSVIYNFWSLWTIIALEEDTSTWLELGNVVINKKLGPQILIIDNG